ncbi:MAG: hypothetical protein AAGH19_10760 [Pseudomonadota bacterium]
MRPTPLLLIPFVTAALLSSTARAALTITIEESGDDVVVSYSGSINTGALIIGEPVDLGPGETARLIEPPFGLVANVDPTAGTPTFFTAPLSDGADTRFGNGSDTSADSATGDNFLVAFEIDAANTVTFVLDSAYRGGPLSGSLTFTNESLCNLGADVGTYTAEFGLDNTFDTVTIEVIAPSFTPTLSPPRADAAYAVRECDQMFVQIDLASGAVTEIGPTGGDDIDALSFSPSGVLYGVDNGEDQLVTIDLDSGARSVVAPFSGAATEVINTGLAFDPSGALYMVTTEFNIDDAALYTVNPGTALLTQIGGVPTDPGFDSLAFAPNGTLYSVGNRDDDDSALELVTLNTSTAERTVIGPLGVQGDNGQGLTVAINGLLYLVDEETRALYSVNTSTGAATLIGDVENDYEGLAAPNAAALGSSATGGGFTQPVPVSSPWMLMLLLLGLSGLAATRLRGR